METKRFTHLPCRVPLTLAYPKTEALVTGCGGPGRTEAVRSQCLIYVARFAGTWGMGGGGGSWSEGRSAGSRRWIAAHIVGIRGAPPTPSPATVAPHPLGKPLCLPGSLPHPWLCKA